MNKGRVLVSGTPQELVDSLDGRVWSASVARSDVAAVREQHAVISTRLYTGKTQVNVIADSSPGPAFDSVEPTLEDAYFAAIGGHLGTNGAAAGQVVSEGAVFASAAR
jgi:hypothetical protein